MVAELFTAALKRINEKALSAIDLLVAADQLNAAGETQFVLALYQAWIEQNQADPLLYAMYFNYGVLLSGSGDSSGAKAALSNAIRLNPDFFHPYINLGFVFEREGKLAEAVNQWYAVVNRLAGVTGDAIAHKTSAIRQIGRVFERVNLDASAEDILRVSLEINPHQHDVMQHWVSLRQRQCKWPVVKPWSSITREQILNGISPLSLAAYSDDPVFQLGNAYTYNRKEVRQPAVSYADGHKRLLAGNTPPRLKIGYLSSDLREHSVGLLTAEIFELHDRAKVELYAYYCGHQVSDPTFHRIRGASEHWLDISGMSDEQAARRMAEDGLHIVVDLNGYTHGARTNVLAMRPAPIVVNWLGYPGTTASPVHNYIIADEFIIPPEAELYYSERVLRLPCYQPNDRKRIVSDRASTRAEAGLPENAAVYCCFNGPHKFTPHTWKRWMSILEQVPGSVLWLIEGVEDVNKRLREHAAAAGIASERIVFAQKKLNPEHLARYPLADLFLDTCPYGAHTTASDALWMGVPVLTLAGRSFASRVCGSLVRSAGAGELVCTTPEGYVARAVELGRDRGKCQAIRQKLLAARNTCVLFDTPLLVSRLEGLYGQMWAEFAAGRMGRPDLTNLEVYNDVGVEIDRDEVDLLTIGNYLDIYRDRLARRDAYSALPPDRRLWSGSGDGGR